MIPLRRRHPSYEVLSRHADRELPAADAMRINAHLVQCQACRDEVDFMVDLRARLGTLEGPHPPRTLLPAILGLRAMGERVALELEPELDGAQTRARRLLRGAMPAAALLLAAGLALFGFSRVEAGSSRVTFDLGSYGQPTRIQFRTPGPLAGETVVRVRGEYYDEVGHDWEETLSIPIQMDLPRRDVGEFSGDLRLPTVPIYARVSVESTSGEVTADGFGFWEHLERRADGAPTFRALMAKSRADVQRLDYHSALESVTQLADLYPDRAEAWSLKRIVESETSDPAAEPSRRVHQERLESFVERLDQSAAPDHLAALAYYALGLEELETYEQLIRRLDEVAPGHPFAIQARVARLYGEFSGTPSLLFAAFEDEWNAYGALTPDLLESVVSLAATVGDIEVTVRWFDRWVAAYPSARGEAALYLATLPAASAEVLARLDKTIEWLDSGHLRRPVGTSARHHRADTDRLRHRLRRALGELQIRAGGVVEGYSNLVRAAAMAWDTELFEALGTLAAERGDMEAAISYRTLAAADPIASEAVVDRQRRALESLGVGESRFDLLLAAARPTVKDRILGGQDVLHVDGPLAVWTGQRIPRDLLSEFGPEATIVHFWSPYLPSSLESVTSLLEHCEELAVLGVRVLAVSEDTPDDPATSTPESAATCGQPWFYDLDRAATMALRATAVSEIVVLSGDGTLRYRGTDPDDARRAVNLVARSR